MSETLSPTPNTPIVLGQMISSSNVNLVKTATPDIILFDDQSLSTESMADLIFENIGGQEISYQPIKNVKLLQQSYNPNNILGIQKTSDKYFAGFPILFDQKFPNEGSGLNGQNIYVDESGNLVIEAIGLNNDEQIEVQLSTSGTIYIVQLDGNES
jgi:hypothetical protein